MNKNINRGNVRRIIIFRQGQFGDTLVAFPVIEALHRLYQDLPIVYCTNHFMSKKFVQGGDVAKLSPYISDIITYNVEDSITQKYRELKKALNVSKNDLLIYLPYSTVQRYQILRDWIFFKALNFKNILCVKETWEWTYKYKQKGNNLPKESERMLEFLRSSSIPLESPKKCVLNFDKDWVEQKWKEWKLNNKQVVAVCPGSKMQSKRWPLEYYIKVGQEWHKQTGMSYIIIGGPEESELANAVIKHWPGYGFSACGVSLGQTAGILSRVKAYCGNDTGSMHLAALLGIPCIAIFSSREPAKLWFPFGENHIVLRESIECENCFIETCYTSPPECLSKISVEKVLDALSAIFPQSTLQ